MKRIIPILFFFLYSSLYAQKPDYELGRGLQIGQLPLYLGGYFSVEYENSDSDKALVTLDELSLMVYGEKDHLSYMLELEGEDIYTSSESNDSASIHLERFFINYGFNENYEIKLGKFNSLIGIWNQTPINVLRDTSSNPIITEQLFPKFTSGVELKYHTFNDHFLSINTMFQEGEDFDKVLNENVYNNFETDRHYGLGVSFWQDEIHYQFNTGYFQLTTGESYTYLLGAFGYEQPDYKLQGELGTQFSEGENTIPYMGYLQGSYTIQEHHEAILRVESYHNRNTQIKDTFAVIGYTYRPRSAVAVKGEYQWHKLKEENELVLSISVLF